MKSSLAACIGVLLLAAGLIGAGLFFFSRHGDEAKPHEAPSDPTANTSSDAEANAQPDVIRLPRDAWAAAGLRVQEAIKGPMTETIELTGKVTLNEDRLAHVFPLVEGRVEEVKVRFGQRVKKNDLLLLVQSKEVGQRMLQLFQDRLQLEFAQVKDRWTQDVGKNTHSMIEMMRGGATVEKIEEALTNRPLGDYRQSLMTAYVGYLKAKSHLERLSPLSERGAVPARQILEAEAEVNATRATLQSLWEQIAQDTIQASRLSAQKIRELQTSIAVSETNLKIIGFTDADIKNVDPAVKGEQLAHYPVIAPFDGTIISKDVVLLERVGPERQILTIADLSTVWVTADIYESHLPLLAQLSDQTLRFHCDALPDRTFEAKIFYTGDVVQESTRTLSLRAAALNPEGLLKPGMFVTVILPSLQTGEVVQIPASAVLDHEGSSFVFVQTGAEEFLRRDVTLGKRGDERIEIRSGLQVGDRVVTDGGFALKSRMLADLLAE